MNLAEGDRSTAIPNEVGAVKGFWSFRRLYTQGNGGRGGMMHSNFSWDCPNCKNINWEHTVDEYKGYRCGQCKKEYQLSFEVEVVDIDEVESTPQTNLLEVRISKDRGKTWYTDEIDTRDLNPKTAQVKPEDWLEVNGNVWEVSVNESNTRLHTKKIGVLSLIK